MSCGGEGIGERDDKGEGGGGEAGAGGGGGVVGAGDEGEGGGAEGGEDKKKEGEGDVTCNFIRNAALFITKTVGGTVAKTRAYLNFGNACNKLGKFPEAMEYYDKCLSTVKELGDGASEVWIHCNIGNTYNGLGKFQEAIEFYNKGLEIAKEIGNRKAEALAYCNLGNAYKNLGEFQKEIEYCNRYLAIAKEFGLKGAERLAYYSLGIAYHHIGELQEAVRFHNKGLSIANELDDRAAERQAYSNLGIAYFELGVYEDAIEYLNKGLSIAKEHGDRAAEKRAYCNLGNVYSELGELPEAIDYHEKCLSIAKELGDRVTERIACNKLAYVFKDLGKLQETIEYFNKGLSIAKELGDRAAVQRTYSNLGTIHNKLGKYQEAIKYHNEGLSIAKTLGNRAAEGRENCNIGNAYMAGGKLQEAIEYYQKDLVIARAIDDKEAERRACWNLGIIYEELSKYQEVEDYDLKSLSIDRELIKKVGEIRTYRNRGNAYLRLGKYQEATEYYKKVLSISKDIGNRATEALAYCYLGIACNHLGKFQEAIDYYQSSVKHYNALRASRDSKDDSEIPFRDFQGTASSQLWITLLHVQKIDEALCAAEQARTQSLVDSLDTQYGLSIPSATSLDAKENISYFSSDSSTQTVFVGLNEHNIYFWVISEGNKVSFRQREVGVRNLLQSTMEEIEAGVGVKCENRSLDQHPDDSSFNTRSEKTSQYTYSSLQPLYEAVISPIADLLQADELILVPDGTLCLAPLSALSKSIRIRTVPCLSILRLIADSPEDYHSKTGALLVGDPCLEKVTNERGKPKFAQLDYAKIEVNMIGEILNIQPLTGTAATKKEVLERFKSVALVHIAAHGRPETGEIALAPNPGWEYQSSNEQTLISKVPKEEDYILKMSDVQAVKIRARLVVLSCCHSDREDVRSEGLVGTAWAFLAAGARSVLMSLWAIDDDATIEFMKSFYQDLKNGKRASVALRHAMNILRESEMFCDVKYWSPFVLIGDDVTIEFGGNECRK